MRSIHYGDYMTEEEKAIQKDWENKIKENLHYIPFVFHDGSNPKKDEIPQFVKFCFDCGEQLEKHDVFCSNCGTEQIEFEDIKPSRIQPSPYPLGGEIGKKPKISKPVKTESLFRDKKKIKEESEDSYVWHY